MDRYGPKEVQGRSFRLIDFGRSVEWADRMNAAMEESSVMRLFKNMAGI
jgi:hypothetical protein